VYFVVPLPQLKSKDWEYAVCVFPRKEVDFMKVEVVGRNLKRNYYCYENYSYYMGCIPKKYEVDWRRGLKGFTTIKTFEEGELGFSFEIGDLIFVDGEYQRVLNVIKNPEENALQVVIEKELSIEDDQKSLIEAYKEKSERLEKLIERLFKDVEPKDNKVTMKKKTWLDILESKEVFIVVWALIITLVVSTILNLWVF